MKLNSVVSSPLCLVTEPTQINMQEITSFDIDMDVRVSIYTIITNKQIVIIMHPKLKQ